MSLETSEDYQEASAWVDEHIDAEEGTEDHEKLKTLIILLEEYEWRFYRG